MTILMRKLQILRHTNRDWLLTLLTAVLTLIKKVPIHPLARSLCNTESIVGQLYPATILARLVTLELATRNTQLALIAARTPMLNPSINSSVGNRDGERSFLATRSVCSLLRSQQAQQELVTAGIGWRSISSTVGRGATSHPET